MDFRISFCNKIKVICPLDVSDLQSVISNKNASFSVSVFCAANYDRANQSITVEQGRLKASVTFLKYPEF